MPAVHLIPRSGAKSLFASAARTASADSTTVTLGPYMGAIVSIDATASAATPSVVFTIKQKTSQGDWVSVLSSAAVTGAGETILTVGPGCATTANVSTGTYLLNQIRLHAEAADADSLTYSATAVLIP